ncbi:hypothetical protein [Streptomyces sp. NPDC058694]|uniref:hypothetical protein n=1 Tax=Streptomyces sp. NPDC058694 TaxID=3346603 RepID=UPI00364B5A20
MNRFRREGGWRSKKDRSQVSSNVKARDNNVIQALSAGRDISGVGQATPAPAGNAAVEEVRVSLGEFRVALERLDPGDNREAGLRAVARIENALEDPAGRRDTIEGAADTIAVVGRSVGALAGAATAVHQAVAALLS